MTFLSKVPRWVREYPIELDRVALTALIKKGKIKIDEPREMNFQLFNFSSAKSLAAAISKAELDGWSCRSEKQADNSELATLIATKSEYVISEEQYKRDTIFFFRLAEMYDAEYDGWFASS
jgi:Regulator of ribonuclease activity B